MKLKTAQIPTSILEYSNQVFRRKIRKFFLNQEGKVYIGIPWHEACREYFRLYKLVDEKNKKISVSNVGQEISQSGWSEGSLPKHKDDYFEIPTGHIVVKISTYPESLTIYTAKNEFDQFRLSPKVPCLKG